MRRDRSRGEKYGDREKKGGDGEGGGWRADNGGGKEGRGGIGAGKQGVKSTRYITCIAHNRSSVRSRTKRWDSWVLVGERNV
jgi:hypothetical protein